MVSRGLGEDGAAYMGRNMGQKVWYIVDMGGGRVLMVY